MTSTRTRHANDPPPSTPPKLIRINPARIHTQVTHTVRYRPVRSLLLLGLLVLISLFVLFTLSQMAVVQHTMMAQLEGGRTGGGGVGGLPNMGGGGGGGGRGTGRPVEHRPWRSQFSQFKIEPLLIRNAPSVEVNTAMAANRRRAGQLAAIIVRNSLLLSHSAQSDNSTHSKNTTALSANHNHKSPNSLQHSPVLVFSPKHTSHTHSNNPTSTPKPHSVPQPSHKRSFFDRASSSPAFQSTGSPSRVENEPGNDSFGEVNEQDSGSEVLVNPRAISGGVTTTDKEITKMPDKKDTQIGVSNISDNNNNNNNNNHNYNNNNSNNDSNDRYHNDNNVTFDRNIKKSIEDSLRRQSKAGCNWAGVEDRCDILLRPTAHKHLEVNETVKRQHNITSDDETGVKTNGNVTIGNKEINDNTDSNEDKRQSKSEDVKSDSNVTTTDGGVSSYVLTTEFSEDEKEFEPLYLREDDYDIAPKEVSTAPPTKAPTLKPKRKSKPRITEEELRKLPLCPEIPPGLMGRLEIDLERLEALNVEDVLEELEWVLSGGRWSPVHEEVNPCLPRHKVAVILPYRDRLHHLVILLSWLHPILRRQQLDYTIYVAEQAGNATFNKGSIMNAGFMEAWQRSDANCFVFHDVDLLPEDDRNMYSCPPQPRHLSVGVDTLGYKLPYFLLVGGVLSVRGDHFLKLNGYSNMYWGWGGEDDDMGYRIKQSGLSITRPPNMLARYTMIRHLKRRPLTWKVRGKLVRTSGRRYRLDGLNTLKYTLLSIHRHPLFTHLLLDVGSPPENLVRLDAH